MSHYALRGQIMAYCNSLRALLEDFPTIRDTFFMVGQPQEKKGLRDSKEGLKADPRCVISFRPFYSPPIPYPSQGRGRRHVKLGMGTLLSLPHLTLIFWFRRAKGRANTLRITVSLYFNPEEVLCLWAISLLFQSMQFCFPLESPEISISHTLLHKPASKISKQISKLDLELSRLQIFYSVEQKK